MTMQVLVLAVQNAVDYEVLGAATSGVTLFRGIGGSLGTAVFGTIFTTRLASELTGALPAAARGASSRAARRLTGEQVARLPGSGARRLPARLRRTRCSPVFLVAAGVALRSASCSAGCCRSARCGPRRRPAAGWRTRSRRRRARTRWPRSSAR